MFDSEAANRGSRRGKIFSNSFLPLTTLHGYGKIKSGRFE